MANTFANMTLDGHIAANVVSRELHGLIPAVARNSTADKAAVNQTIYVPIAPASTSATITAGQLPPDTGDQTISSSSITISNFKAVPVRWTGEEQAQLNTGAGYQTIFGNQLEEAIRTLVNEMEATLGGLYTGASRAVRPNGTTLFDASDYQDLANVRKELNVNGAPMMDRHLILSNVAGAAFAGNAQNTAVNTTGDNTIMNQGLLGTRFGMNLRESHQIQDHTAGTSSGHLVNDASLAVGDTTITVDTGSGTILAGDIVSFAGDSNEYVVATALSGSTFTIAAPGLLTAVADNSAITVRSDANRSMAFSRNALMLATRIPYAPAEGDSAMNSTVITDPRSGLSFELRQYGEYRRVKYEVAAAWGAAVIKPEHLMLLVD